MLYRDLPKPKSVTASEELVSHKNQRGERVDEQMQSTMDPIAVDIYHKRSTTKISPRFCECRVRTIARIIR